MCAAGLTGSNADDVAKEVAIYRAHKAAPIVIATEGEERFSAAVQAIKVPATHPSLAFVLSAMAGHLFGYEAALAIDAQALPAARGPRRDRGGGVVARRRDPSRRRSAAAPRCGRRSSRRRARFFDGLRTGAYDGHLEARTAVRLSSLLRYALGISPLEAYQVEYGKVGTPAVVVDDLTVALTRGIEELTRPVDAIKHQAKTVTVGISRSDETLLQVPLVEAVLAAGAPRDSLSYRTLRTLADLDPAVDEVTGCTRYRIEGDPDDRRRRCSRRSSTAVASPPRSRRGTERDPVPARHEAHRRDRTRAAGVRGRSDGRTFDRHPGDEGQPLHRHHAAARPLRDDCRPRPCRGVLQGYRSRYAALKDAVTETEPTFREDLLGELPVLDLLTEPVHDLADRWRTDVARDRVVGVDVVDLDRFRRVLAAAHRLRRPGVHPSERDYCERRKAAIRSSATPPASPPRRR